MRQVIFGKCLVILYIFLKGIFATAPVIDLRTCTGGCKIPNDCPPNSACIPFLTQTCGICLCTIGYTLNNNGDCVRIDASSSPSQTFGQQVPPKRIPEEKSGLNDNGNQGQNASSTVNSGDNSNGENGPPIAKEINPNSADNEKNIPDAVGFDCNKYKCDGQGCGSDSSPTNIQCPNLAGGGQCMLGTCFRVNSSVSYCLCPLDRQSRTCHVKKSGNCNNADGKMPNEVEEEKGKRFRHIRDAENGAVLARHTVDSLSDCVRLCQWATFQQCRSINYGNINGVKICELLTVWASKDSVLSHWLKDDPNWSYVCCFK